VKRSEVGQLLKCRLDLGVEHDRAREPLAPVHDAMANGIGSGHLGESLAQGTGVDLSALDREVRRRDQLFGFVERSLLDAARPGVYCQDPFTARTRN
jgi:hypothetical protein